jgi:phage/plasmid-like protein (TIGR03299 family)
MLSLLEQALEATTSRHNPVIVSASHDTADINWVAGMSDPGEMIGCGMYQQLRRLAGEQDGEYQRRITAELAKLPADIRDRITTTVRAAAIKRASLDATTGKVSLMVAGKLPWHGLGVNIESATDSANALRLSGTDWKMRKEQNFYKGSDGTMRESIGSFSVVRNDTDAVLGTVGRVYQLFQNSEGFEFLDSVIGEFGAKYEAAGSLHGGKTVFMLVHLPQQAFDVTSQDRVEPYAIFTNCNDGSGAAKCYPTSVRVVCANTLRVSAKDRKKGISLRHSGKLAAQVTEAQTALGMTVRGLDEFRENAAVLAATKVEPIAYFDGVLDLICDVTVAGQPKDGTALARALAATESAKASERAAQEIAAKKLEKEVQKRRALFDEVMSRYESPTNGVGDIRGSGWSAMNAVTESVSHGGLGGRYNGDIETRASRRFESVLEGDGDDINQIAYDMAMASVATSR